MEEPHYIKNILFKAIMETSLTKKVSRIMTKQSKCLFKDFDLWR
jgi:hypothetical protein